MQPKTIFQTNKYENLSIPWLTGVKKTCLWQPICCFYWFTFISAEQKLRDKIFIANRYATKKDKYLLKVRCNLTFPVPTAESGVVWELYHKMFYLQWSVSSCFIEIYIFFSVFLWLRDCNFFFTKEVTPNVVKMGIVLYIKWL